MKIGCRETSDFFVPFSQKLVLFAKNNPLIFCIVPKNLYLCSMKQIDWKKALVFLIVIGGLIYITKAELGMTNLNSFLTTLGILLILFVGDNFAQKIDDNRRRRKIEEDGKAN